MGKCGHHISCRDGADEITQTSRNKVMNTCYDNGNDSKSRKYCSVPGCGARWGTMFSFPKDTTMSQRWKFACKIQRADVAGSTVICISHFGDSDISVTRKFRKNDLNF